MNPLGSDYMPSPNTNVIRAESTASFGSPARSIESSDAGIGGGGDSHHYRPNDVGSDHPMTQSTIKRRAPVACRRCRRMRSKCVHEKSTPPCKSCADVGLGPADCVFPVRGQPDNDREYRHPRTRAEKTKRDRSRAISTDQNQGSNYPEDDWDLLPPIDEIIAAVNAFTQHYFQLGFIPKAIFPARISAQDRSISVFLLLSILAVSSRFTPLLIARFNGDGLRAADTYTERASLLAGREVYEQPTLERCQAFYLLSIAQQGSGWKNRSYINMGISIRMALLMQLHREETFIATIYENPNPEFVIHAESARRTLWMLHSQENLHSGPSSPVSLSANDITTLLPCSEAQFAAGVQPPSRASLEGTLPATLDPRTITDPNRSLFASLIQIHNFWGSVARRAMSNFPSKQPWEPNSDFAIMNERLQAWESGLPRTHIWSPQTLRDYRVQKEDLAYLGVTMMPRMCHIVLRRAHLADMLRLDPNNRQQHGFFQSMARELFANVYMLFDQIHHQFSGRASDESVGAQMTAFIVYTCGLFATYLAKFPHVCPDETISRHGPGMLREIISILDECKNVWPIASSWLESLERLLKDPNAGLVESGMADGRDPIPRALPLSCPPSHAKPLSLNPKAFGPSVPFPVNDPNALNPILPHPYQSGSSPQLQGQQYLGYYSSGIDTQQPLPSTGRTHHGTQSLSLQSQQSGQQAHHGPMLVNPAFSMSHPVGVQGSQMAVSASAVLESAGTGTVAGIYETGQYYSPAASSLGLGNDGFDNELQFYIDGDTQYVPDPLYRMQ